MYPYHQSLSNHCGFKINAIMKCGTYMYSIVFDWQCEKTIVSLSTNSGG